MSPKELRPKKLRPNQIKNNVVGRLGDPSRRLNQNAPRTGIGLRGQKPAELPAEAPTTKVSKPVLFALKMTDFQ